MKTTNLSSADLEVLSIEERFELVADLVLRVGQLHPLSEQNAGEELGEEHTRQIELFDAAWATVRAEKPFRHPSNCPLAKRVTSQFLPEILDHLNAI